MPFARTCLAVLLCLALAFPVLGQQSTASNAPVLQRETQALSLLSNALTAMGGNIPSDSIAKGTVTIVAGSETSQGTVTVLTRGTNQTSVEFQTTNGNWSVIYSKGQANKVDASEPIVLPLELAASSQCAYFLSPVLFAFLSNPDVSLRYLGQETVSTSTANHIRAQNTFQSTPQMQFLTDFTTIDLWLDSASALPLQVSFVRRHGGGDSAKIPITIFYSNYQSVSGVQYPFTIEESVNGTPWATTTIQSVVFNTNLTDANFPVGQGDSLK